jgi:hypothetical protein
MPNLTPGDVHVSVPLSTISVAFRQNQALYIADQVFPNIPVQKQADRYYKYDRGQWFRTDSARRAPATETVGTGWTVTTDTYYADVWGIHTDIDDQLRANADTAFNLDADATEFVTNMNLLRRDKEWIAKYFTTSVWTGSSSGGDITGVAGTPTSGQVKQWDQAGSTPIEDIFAQRLAMMEKTGYMPNVLVLGPRVWQALVNHAEIIDRVKYTQAGFISQDIVATALGIDKILVAWAIENTAAENATPGSAGAQGTNSFMFGKQALLAYANPTPSTLTPSAGYTFSWNGYMGASTFGTRIKKFRMENIASDRIESEMAFALKVVAAELGVFFTSLVS